MSFTQEPRIKHDYTDEIELKSILIREKNKLSNTGDINLNDTINKLIKQYLSQKTGSTKEQRDELRDKITELSEQCLVDNKTHERFGEIILLMIHNILKKPNFSGYSWRDDFYSDSIYKIFKYLHNFDHKKTSQITGQPVKAFSYITQIIHNSILFIINTKNIEKDELDKISQQESISLGLDGVVCQSTYTEKEPVCFEITIKETENLYESLINIPIPEKSIIIYPNNYKITYDEFNNIKQLLNKITFSLIKQKTTEVSNDSIN